MPTSIYEQFINDLADAVAARLNGSVAAATEEAPAERQGMSRADALAKARAAKKARAEAEKAAATPPAKKAGGATKKAGGRKAKPKTTYSRDDLEELNREELLELAEELGYELPTPKARTTTIIEGILEIAGEEEPEEEDEEPEEDDEEAEESDEDEEAEGGDDYWSREELEDKSKGELIAIAKEYELDTKGLGKDELIDLIMSDE